ncbi:MAG: hypothetical protein E7223_01855 [Clostridiales bacterium]|nr:hypothetical protein [Clostridiales bacterium]
MIQETITYLQVGAPENTKIALELAVKAAREQGIKDLVVASTVGTTAAMLADEIDCSGLHVTIVGHAFDQKEPGTNPMAPELRQHLKDKGFDVIHAAHALSGAERCLSGKFGGVYPVEVIAYTLRMLGQGTKVCVEIGAMAADAGCVVSGQPIVAVGGTGRGADTVEILRPAVSSKILQTKIDRILCKPLE